MNNVEELINKAKEAMKNAYAPYSNFHVGASVLLKNGKFITGSNIENASYGLSNCAERSCLFATYSLGYRKDDIVMMAIAADFPGHCSPCGACRQVMAELLNKDCPVYLIDKDGSVHQTTNGELLPFSFDEGSLK